MKIPLLNSCLLRSLTLACLFAAGFMQPAGGQISALKKAVDGDASATAAPETPEQMRARIDQWHTEARDALAKLETPDTADKLPEGVTALEFDDRRRGLEGMVMISAQWLKSIDGEKNALKNLQSISTEEWSGFKEKPPYSILMLDDLLNDRDAMKARLVTNEASHSNYQRILAGLLTDTKVAEEQVSASMVTLQKASDTDKEAAKWRLEAAREKSRQLVARSALIQSNCDELLNRITAIRADLALLERKIKTASANYRFSDEDFAKVTKISEARKRTVQKQSDAITKRLKAAKVVLNQAQSALDALTEKADGGDPSAALELAKYRRDVCQERVETLQDISEWLEGMPQLENIAVEAYENRREILDATTSEQREAALAALRRIIDRIKAWDNVIDSEIANSESDLGQLEFRAGSVTPDDPRFTLINEQRAIKSERLAMTQRISESVIGLNKLVARWIKEYSPKPEDAGLFPRVRYLSSMLWENVKKLWSLELMRFEDKVVVDGQTLVGHIPITVGMLLRALLFFAVGYLLASRLVGHIQDRLVSRGVFADAQARTLRNWAMILVGVFLALGTLTFLKIPLTVFAFFGGALAIGLGFGLQTLIKNFISGIIVLAERKVRVGDILDVDGIIGTVVEVNTRSSVIRSADDVETMIPNSLFLENRVTNWTLTSSKMRRKLTVGVAYGTSPQVVMEVLTEAAARHGLIVKEPAPFAVFEDFGDSALVFTLYFWVNMHGSGNAMVITSDLRLMIEKRFGELNIGVPYPQRDMHLTTDKPIQVQMAPAPESTPDE